MTTSNKMDLNDLSVKWISAGLTLEEQRAQVQAILSLAQPVIAHLADEAGRLAPDERDGDWSPEYEDAVDAVVEMASKMDEKTLGKWRAKLARKCRMSLRDFNNALAGERKKAKGKKEDVPEIATFGGWYQSNDGLYFVDYWLDYKEKTGHLVWRDPQGGIHTGEQLILNNNGIKVKLIPVPPEEEPSILPAQGQESASVVMPPGVHLEPVQLGEVLREVVDFMKEQYLFDDERTPFVIGMQIVNSWVYENFRTLAYLRAIGDTGSGKSELMRRAGHLCYRLTKANGSDSESVFFRLTDLFRGTLFVDEADLQDSSSTNNIIKFYNLGAMDGNYINRSEEWINPRTGAKTFRVRSFATFCPKIFCQRSESEDAVGSRSLDIRLIGKSMQELKEAGIELEMGSRYWAGWQRLVPKLLRLRMQMIEPQKIDMDMNLADVLISPRFNQVTMSIKMLAQRAGDYKLLDYIQKMLREKYAEEVAEKSMETEARVVEALWKMYIYPDLRQRFVVRDDGAILVKIGDVTAIANNIIEEMKEEGSDLRVKKEIEDGQHMKPKKSFEIGTQRVGRIMRDVIQLKRLEQRTNKGFFCIWDDVKMEIAGRKFGVLPEEEKIEEARQALAAMRAKVDLNRKPLQIEISEPPAPPPTQGDFVW